MSKRGAFIVIEGLDRSGKSTQTALLLSRLESARIPAKLLKFPDRTTAIGKMIDSYLKSQSDLDDHAIHLLFSANRWELASSIEHLLAAGTTVVCDRYAFSGIAFSASKGLPYEWCRAPDVSLPAPDLAVFLDITPEAAKARGGYGEERYEKEEMQRRVREVFRRIGEEIKGSGLGAWVWVDAGREKGVVAEEVWGHVELLARGVEGPLCRLWTDEIPA
ncbi:putative thymidylate kinase [Lyophyllum shimeji]|uniref:Thymidylate kinase n=1 Tax=Lyophyllum shimeji TaxID=47721 RepID=A0A9P3PY84_LYOSH|nr:putative thymidylate kinase [Lyophyllum shimeji]